MHAECEVSTFGHRRDIETFAKFKSKSRDLDSVPIWVGSVLLTFYTLQFMYVLNLNPIALAIPEISWSVY